MRLSKLFLNRTLLAFGLVRGLFVVWQTLDPNPVTFLAIALLGVGFTLLADGSLRKLDKYLDPAAKPIAAAIFLALLLTLRPQYAVAWLISIHIDIRLYESRQNPIVLNVPAVLIKTLKAKDHLNPLKRWFLSLPANFLSRRHGAYPLHPVTSSLLYYS